MRSKTILYFTGAVYFMQKNSLSDYVPDLESFNFYARERKMYVTLSSSPTLLHFSTLAVSSIIRLTCNLISFSTSGLRTEHLNCEEKV